MSSTTNTPTLSAREAIEDALVDLFDAPGHAITAAADALAALPQIAEAPMTDTPTNTSAQETVARIIEPHAWSVLDACGGDVGHPYLDQKVVIKGLIETSLTRADAILALPQIAGPMEAARRLAALESEDGGEG